MDAATVAGFGDEWRRFNQSAVSPAEMRRRFDEYFCLFPWQELPPQAEGFDMGSGSGRWAKLVAPRVGKLHCIDASAEALEVSRAHLQGITNCCFHHASVSDLPLADDSMDFGYSLGVLHHIPDTAAGLACCVRKLKRGAPFLVYIYYRFDNRPSWFRSIWAVSDALRRVVCRMPSAARAAISQAIAAGVYLPLARTAALAERRGFDVAHLPLSAYRQASFYAMRTDALDRFGTRLEKRFTKLEIQGMMEACGLERIRFSEQVPFWCAVGYRR
ncbi:MAG TPA: methyltransferase domain-containing protein [Gemmatimonadales bacterium]|nr:methyltransferase domain-containing protein [Gemmatimonadales bacterium]